MRTAILALTLTLAAAGCGKPAALDTCNKLVAAGVASNCRADTPAGLGAAAKEDAAFDLPSVPTHGSDEAYDRTVRKNPSSRRLIVSGWNPKEADQVALPPCHTLFQFYVQRGKLSCQLYQRSGDVFLGVPFNIASYALLTRMIAQVTGLGAGELVHTLGDAHLYNNHVEQAKEQLERAPRRPPRLVIDPGVHDLFAFELTHFALEGYDPHPHIKAEVSV